VEEMAAAASSLKSQAGDLVQVVSVFKLAAGQQTARPVSVVPAVTASQGAHKPAFKPALTAAPKLAPKLSVSAKPAPSKPSPQIAAPMPKPAPRVTPAGGDDDWETF
jgi:methyl-accepting chemotaxis protein